LFDLVWHGFNTLMLVWRLFSFIGERRHQVPLFFFISGTSRHLCRTTDVPDMKKSKVSGGIQGFKPTSVSEMQGSHWLK
jgi:hypothetical protein